MKYNVHKEYCKHTIVKAMKMQCSQVVFAEKLILKFSITPNKQ